MKMSGIVDSTLREGIQRPGVTFSISEKMRIIEKLVALGIEEIEIGVASLRSSELLSLIPRAVAAANKQTHIALWSRCREQDILFAHRCGPDTLSLSIPVSDILLREKCARDRSWVLEQLSRSISFASELGFAAISVGLEDATRADPDFLIQVAKSIAGSAASRIRIADTVGVGSPATISALVRAVRKATRLPLGVHTHNDFGMATANGVAALESGANWVDATVLGIGERSGNCRLEEIVGFLGLQRGCPRYNLRLLKPLCEVVAEAAEVTIFSHHPVVGKDIFTCESGLHVYALASNPETYEPFDPEVVGQGRTLLYGSKTGKRAVAQTLDAAGVVTTGEQVEELVDFMRSRALSGASPLEGVELVRFARERMRLPSIPAG